MNARLKKHLLKKQNGGSGWRKYFMILDCTLIVFGIVFLCGGVPKLDEAFVVADDYFEFSELPVDTYNTFRFSKSYRWHGQRAPGFLLICPEATRMYWNYHHYGVSRFAFREENRIKDITGHLNKYDQRYLFCHISADTKLKHLLPFKKFGLVCSYPLQGEDQLNDLTIFIDNQSPLILDEDERVIQLSPQHTLQDAFTQYGRLYKQGLNPIYLRIE